MINGNHLDDWSIGWYCIRTKPKLENVAAATIQTLSSVEMFLPRTSRKRKAASKSLYPLFPGYLFARFDPVTHLRNIQFARGVSYIVKRNGIPVHVPSQIMIELKFLTSNGVLEIPDKPRRIGDKVKVISGLFKGGEGDITQLIPSRERIRLLLEILGRSTEVEIGEDQIDFPSAHPMSVG